MSFIDFDLLRETEEEHKARLRSAPGTAHLADREVTVTDPVLKGVIVRLHDAHGDTGITGCVVERQRDTPGDHNKTADGRYLRHRGWYRVVVVKYDRPADASPHNAGYPVGGHDIVVSEAEIRRSPRITL